MICDIGCAVAVDSALRRRRKLKCENVATLIWGCPLIIVRDILILIWDLQELTPLIVTSRAVAARFQYQ
jgi:hypothetical protein